MIQLNSPICTLSRISWRIFSRSSSIFLCFSFRRSSASRIASKRSLSSSSAFSLLSSPPSSSPPPTAPNFYEKGKSVNHFIVVPFWKTHRKQPAQPFSHLEHFIIIFFLFFRWTYIHIHPRRRWWAFGLNWRKTIEKNWFADWIRKRWNGIN